MGFKEKWQHAFALAPEVAPEAGQLPDILERFASTVVKRRMETPTILFLEMVKPLNFLGSQLVCAAVPIAGVFTSADELNQVAKALEHRGAISALVTRIEELSSRR